MFACLVSTVVFKLDNWKVRLLFICFHFSICKLAVLVRKGCSMKNTGTYRRMPEQVNRHMMNCSLVLLASLQNLCCSCTSKVNRSRMWAWALTCCHPLNYYCSTWNSFSHLWKEEGVVTSRKWIGKEGRKYDNKTTDDFIKCIGTATRFSFL